MSDKKPDAKPEGEAKVAAADAGKGGSEGGLKSWLPLIVTMRNVASREMLYCASSSGSHFDQRQKTLKNHTNVVEAIIANA